MNIDWSKIIPKEEVEKIAISEKRANVATQRYEKEIAGILIDGLPFYTDRETQMKLIAASLRAQITPDYSINWKLSNGDFKNFSSDEIVEISNKVGDYVQACYNRESELVKEISEGTYTEDMLSIGWP